MTFPIKGVLAAAIIAVAPLVAGCESGPKSESTGEYIDSTVITTKVKAALVEDPSLSALDIHVDTYKDIVSLSGFVETEEQKERATVVASNIDDVRQVENRLIVK